WLLRHTFLGTLAIITDASEIHPPLIDFPAGWDYLWTTWSPPEKLFLLLDIFFWPLLFLLIPSILMGASFPLIAYLANANADKEAKATGIVYFINVLGNFAGTLITGFILLPYLGSEATFLILALLGICFGFGVTMLARTQVPIAVRGAIVVVLALWM